MKTITFFNNKGGVGKTTTVYHVAWMLSKLGKRTIAVDLDPQSNLTSMFLTDSRLEEVYDNESAKVTILDAITPIVNGDPFSPVHIEQIENLALSAFEDTLSDAWLKCLNGEIYSFKITSIFKTIIDEAAKRFKADYVLFDVGPNLGAINRAITISSDYVIMPVASDLFSLQGIKNLGSTLSKWKNQWSQRKAHRPNMLTTPIPENQTVPIGYIVMQYSAKESRPVKSYLKWANRIPSVFRQYVIDNGENNSVTIDKDPYCVALLKHYRSLAPMSMEAHKPIFLLKPADGAIGAHTYAVTRSYDEFEALTKNIMDKCL
jgi:chromosome partitioning protein